MKQTVSDLQKRRADNIIWTCAGDYSFVPDFKAYREDGSVDLYWNVIFGAARRRYDYRQLEGLFAMLDKYRDAAFYQGLFWNALEPLLYRAELEERPALARLRPEPGETELRLDESMSTTEIVEAARAFFYARYGLYGDGKIRLSYRLRHLRRLSVDSFLQRGPILFHEKEFYHGDVAPWAGENTLSTRLTESEMRDFLETKFGKSAYPAEQVLQLERKLCTGNHRFTHLFYTRGEIVELRGVYSTFEMHQRKRVQELIAENRAYYRANERANRVQIGKLSTRIMNSVLLHMQPEPVKANAGAIDPALAWRGARLDDDRIFRRMANENAGDMSVDILLDASHSQVAKAAKISSQAYIIAEALSRCHVPCRVMSFCSMSGFTVLRLFNDYAAGDNRGIFEYSPEGCNRDGLALRAAGELMSRAPFEHKMLIVLSDVKPLDIAKIRRNEGEVGLSYDGIRALTDTAQEVRRLRAEGISVICVFTGADLDLPYARMVYGQDFVRIRDHSQFADAVGKLILDQMKQYAT